MHSIRRSCKLIRVKKQVNSLFRQGVALRSRIVVDETTNESVRVELKGEDRSQYFFGENVGLLTFQDWFPTIELPRHMCHMQTYDFPVRLKFVLDPFDSAPFLESSPDLKGWNLPAWQKAAFELQEQGVRAIVCG